MTALPMPAFLRGLFRSRLERPTRRFLISCEVSRMTWEVQADSYPALYLAIADAVFGVSSVTVLQALAEAGWYRRGPGNPGRCLSIREIE